MKTRSDVDATDITRVDEDQGREEAADGVNERSTELVEVVKILLLKERGESRDSDVDMMVACA